MSFVDELNNMPAPKKPKTPIDWLVEKGHDSLKQYCTLNRQSRKVHGFLIYDDSAVRCFSSLYKHQYPYLVEIKGPNYFKKNSKTVLDLGDDSFEFGTRAPISKDISFCKNAISELTVLLEKDGFLTVDLKPVPVYAALVKQYYKNKGLTKVVYYEEGQLTNQLEGYVIEFALEW